MTTSRAGMFRRGRHDSGASAVEYALILAGVALVGVATLYLLGQGIKGAFIAAEAQTESQPAGVLPNVGTTSAAPGTTSAAPTSSSAAPTSSSAAPTSSSAAPTSSSAAPSASPTTTRQAINITVNGTGTNTILDLNVQGTPTNRVVTMTPDIGNVTWNGDRIEINPDNNTPDNTVTVVTYSYTYNGVNYTGTITVRVNT